MKSGMAGITYIGLAGCMGTDGEEDDSTWTLATSSEGTTAFRIGTVFQEFIQEEELLDEIDFNAVVSGGATAGYRQVDMGDTELGSPSTYELDQSPDEGPFQDQALENFDEMRQIRGFMTTQPFVAIPSDSGIDDWSDLEGQNISVGTSGSSTRVPSEWLVDYEVGLDNVNLEYTDYADQPADLRGGSLDAAFIYINNDSLVPGWVQELDSTIDWEVLPFSNESLDALTTELPYLEVTEFDGGEFFESYIDEIAAYNLGYVWIGLSRLNNDIIYELARISYEYGEELFERDDAMGIFPDPDLFMGTMHPDIPIHEGAYEYYQDEGLLDDYDLSDEQQ